MNLFYKQQRHDELSEFGIPSDTEGESIISFDHVSGQELCLFVAVYYVLTWPGIVSLLARFMVRLQTQFAESNLLKNGRKSV